MAAWVHERMAVLQVQQQTALLPRCVTLAAAGLAAYVPAEGSAQEWDWRLTPYLWGAGVQGDVAVGPVSRDVEMDFSELFDLLAGAALFRAEGGNDTHSFLIDLIWLDLEPEDEIALIGGVAEASFESTTVELSYLRKLEAVDVELGVRYWDIDVELDPALIPSVERGDDWVDGFIGVRVVRELGSNWDWQVRGSVGAGGSDSTWGFETHFARELSRGNRILLGLKALDIDYFASNGGALPLEIDTTFLGATVGFMFD